MYGIFYIFYYLPAINNLYYISKVIFNDLNAFSVCY